MVEVRERSQKHTHLLAVLGDDGLHGRHVGGFHHECDSLSLSDLHYSLEHHGVVVACRQCSYCHHLVNRGLTGSQVEEINEIKLTVLKKVASARR